MWWFLWLLYFLSTKPDLIASRKIADIIWTSSNPIFDISNTDHVINVQIGDRVSIKCPNPSSSTSPTPYEYTYIYMVNEEEYNHCFLHEPRLIGACDNETIETSVNMVFRSFTPTPGGFEFKPGNYYLISTSDGSRNGIDRKKDGLCTTRNMKIKFVVGNAEHSPKFAARTFTKNSPSNNEQVMYVIHDDEDDSVSTRTIYVTIISTLLSLLILY